MGGGRGARPGQRHPRPACGDGALLWDDGSLGFADETKARAIALLAQYDAALEEYTALTEDPEAREKHVHEALWAVDEMVGDLAEGLRNLLA